ncbi:MAG: type 2 isopentenyl-diphosphate Delta-isomerase [Candidatus Puniceispirillales bacterium]
MSDLSTRKDEHIDLAKQDAALAQIPNSLDRVRLTHQALPECDADQIDASTDFLGITLDAPIMISGMTGGSSRGDAINDVLAELANTHKLAFGVGSQRASLSQQNSQSHMRALACDIPLIGNLGAAQLVEHKGSDIALRAIDDLQPDALAIHLNPLQELVQPEGDRNWVGVRDMLANLVKQADIPIIIKEVGAGISVKTVTMLKDIGITYFDIAGLGGTNWTRIENSRTDQMRQDMMAPFMDWGIPTCEALQDLRGAVHDVRLIASGGVRHGLDVARCLWLGADIAAAAGCFIKAVEHADGQLDPERLDNVLTIWKKQLKTAMFLTGSKHIKALKQADGVVTG